jgi:hypothetical protein
MKQPYPKTIVKAPFLLNPPVEDAAFEKAPGFNYSLKGFALWELCLAIEIPNNKSQSPNKLQLPKFEIPNMSHLYGFGH